jgi:hypothetical protein
MFGLDLKIAIRYAENTRQLLITAAEQQDPDGLAERAREGRPLTARPAHHAERKDHDAQYQPGRGRRH